MSGQPNLLGSGIISRNGSNSAWPVAAGQVNWLFGFGGGQVIGRSSHFLSAPTCPSPGLPPTSPWSGSFNLSLHEPLVEVFAIDLEAIYIPT